MKTTHDIFVRAYAVSSEEGKNRNQTRTKSKNSNSPKWPSIALVFDTENGKSHDRTTFSCFP